MGFAAKTAEAKAEARTATEAEADAAIKADARPG
jgi:hypothetical protein